MPANSPKLTLPASEQVISSATIAVAGVNYSDSFAQTNPGELFLGISVSSGTLAAKDASGHAIVGSGSSGFGLEIDYTDLAAVLNSLAYTPSAGGGSDDIQFDIWNQAGVETTGDIPVSITSRGDAAETWDGAVSSDWNTPANWSSDAVPTSRDTVVIAGGTPNSPVLSNATLSETIMLTESGTIAPTVTFNNVTINSVLETVGSGTVQIGGGLTIGAHGTLGPGRDGRLFVDSSTGAAVPMLNDGTITAPTGSILTFDNGGTTVTNTVTVQNNGMISSNGGDINLDFDPPPFGSAPPETLVNAGSISISGSGGLTLNGTFVGNDISFVGTGALGVQTGDAFAGGSEVTGFGPGDQIDLYGRAKGGPLGFSDGILSAGTSTAIPLAGAYGVGDFESEFVGSVGSAQTIAYAPDGGPSDVVQPDIVAPAAASVAQGSTLSLGDVSIDNLGTTTETLVISAGVGTLFMSGATGSGTDQLSLGPTSSSQIDADLATLSYVPAAGATTDTVQIEVSPPAPISTSREIAISITNGGGPVLTEPSSETVAVDGTAAVSGSYSDSFAQANPGELYIGISDSSGTLSATDASGHAVAGSGTNSIGLGADYVDVNAILASLHHTAGSGSDTILFDVWNQAGVETTGATSVTIGGGMSHVSADIGADIASAGSVSVGPVDFAGGSSSWASAGMLSDPISPQVGLPLLGH